MKKPDYVFSYEPLKLGDVVVSINAYEVQCVEMDDDGKIVPLFERKGGVFIEGCNLTPNVDEAAITISASFKWDGCSNVNVSPDFDGYLHFCSISEMTKFCAALLQMNKLARKLIPAIDDEDPE